MIKSRRMRWAWHVAYLGKDWIKGSDEKDRRKNTTRMTHT
jgi:hypothetical protein